MFRSSPPTPAPREPLREITPKERARIARTVALLLLGFFAAVGVMVAYLSVQSRAARDYGDAVLQAARQNPSAVTGERQDCRTLRPGSFPGSVESCVIERTPGGLEVVVRLEGNRQYRAQAPAAP